MDGVLAKIMNSTIGTPKYRPLDEIIRFGDKQLVASDTACFRIDTGAITSAGNFQGDNASEVTVCSFRPIIGGSVRVAANVDLTCKLTETKYVTFGYIYVYVNGELKTTATGGSAGGNVTTNTTIQGDVVFAEGDTVTIKVKAKPNYYISTAALCQATVNYVYLNATVTDALVEVLS